jgi:hypothetical protein
MMTQYIQLVQINCVPRPPGPKNAVSQSGGQQKGVTYSTEQCWIFTWSQDDCSQIFSWFPLIYPLLILASLIATACILVRLHTDLTGLTSPGPSFLVAAAYAISFTKTGMKLSIVVLSGHQDNWRIFSTSFYMQSRHLLRCFIRLPNTQKKIWRPRVHKTETQYMLRM